MPSTPRDRAPGLHHIWVGATGHENYFADGEDRITWIRELVKTSRVHGWTCLAFCQMTTHIHLIVDVPDQSLALGMKCLNMGYSRDFNARHDRVGQFIRRRYGSRRIDDGADLLGVYFYVVSNPVAAGLCPHPADWRWSSYATTLGISSDFPFVDASLVISEAGGTVERLRQFIDGRTAYSLAGRAMAGV
jgi:putative transposase